MSLSPSASLLGTSPIPFISASTSKPPMGASGSISSSVKQQSSFQATFNYGSSPIAKYSIYGSSPPSGGLGSSRGAIDARLSPHHYNAAKKFYSRLLYDTSLNSLDYTVGVVESIEQPGGRRMTDRLVELPFLEFHARHQQGEHFTSHSQSGESKSFYSKSDDVPFHRIAFFKSKAAGIIWESDLYSRQRKISDGGFIADASSLRGSSPIRGASSLKHQASFHEPGPPGGSVERFSSQSFLLGGSWDGEDDGGDQGSDGDEDEAAGMFRMDDEGLPKIKERWEASHPDSPTREEEEEEEEEEKEEARELPEQCWRQILNGLETRGVCMMGRVNKWLKELTMCPKLWHELYARLFAELPGPSLNPAAVRRLCRRSEIRAARWLESEIDSQQVGYPDTMCLQLDESKVVSGDGSSVRVWSHLTGRRIATLKGHTGRINTLAYDENLVVSGCILGALRFWGMDDLKCSRNVRVAHEGSVNGVALLNGIPVSGGSDGSVRLWDVTTGLPILTLESPRHGSIQGLEVHPSSGYIAACGDGVQVYDAASAQLLHDLRLPDYLTHLDPDLEGRRDLAPALLPPHQAHDWEEDSDEDEDDEDEEDALGAVSNNNLNLNPAGSFRCIAYSGSVLAAACNSSIILWDPRCSNPIGVIRSSSLKPYSSSSSSSSHDLSLQCVSLQLDDWKLLAAFNNLEGLNSSGGGGGGGEGTNGGRGSRVGGGGLIALYDIRATPALGRMALESPTLIHKERDAWQNPLLQLEAPSRVYAMRSFGQNLIAGLAGQESAHWSFKAPSIQPLVSNGAVMSGVGFAAACAISSTSGLGLGRNQGEGSPGAPGGGGEWLGTSPGADEKKKKAQGTKALKKPAKQQNRFPKRK